MPNRPNPWAIKSHEQRRASGGLAPIVNFRPEAQSFSPAEEFRTCTPDDSTIVEERLQEPPYHYLPSHGFSSPVDKGDVFSTDATHDREVCSHSSKIMRESSEVLIKEDKESGDSIWPGSPKAGTMPYLPHTRASSDSKNVFNVHYRDLLRPRSRSDCPVADSKESGKFVDMRSKVETAAIIDCDLDASGDAVRTKNLLGGCPKSPENQGMVLAPTRRRSFPKGFSLSHHETISESPEFCSIPFSRTHGNYNPREAQPIPGQSDSPKLGRFGLAHAWDGSDHRDPDETVIQTRSRYSTPFRRSIDSQQPHTYEPNTTNVNTLVPANPTTVLPGYTARQLVEIIKSGMADNPPRTSTVDSSAKQSFRPLESTALPSTSVPNISPPHQPNEAGGAMTKALEGLPLATVGTNLNPAAHGVVKICDIPYNTLRAEVVAFLGRNARLVEQPAGTPYFAVHIIMERQTAKSMDCFVELETNQDAFYAASRFDRGHQDGKRPRIGDRAVSVKVSSQEALMMELFPRAKCVTWEGQNPVVIAANDPFSSGFQGFITNEELVMTTKYAENPNRSRFAAKHPQRAYESMITLLAKYPWWKTCHITLRERDNIFNATLQLISTLRNHLRRGCAMAPLTPMLLEELTIAGLHCPGFSESQRAALIDAWAEFATRIPFVTELAPVWPFETLRRKSDVPELMVMHFAAAIKKSVIALKSSMAAEPWMQPHIGHCSLEQVVDFGGFTTCFQLASHGDKSQMTLDRIAQLELYYLQALIRQIPAA